MDDDIRVDEPALLHCGWQELIEQAETAACRAGRRLAARCALTELRETGRAWIHVEPVDSPVASWLCRHGYGSVTETHDGVLVPVNLCATVLNPAEEAAAKARSLLVAQAYANAYCSVLAEEAGVTAGPVVERDGTRRARPVLESSVLPGPAASSTSGRAVVREVPGAV